MIPLCDWPACAPVLCMELRDRRSEEKQADGQTEGIRVGGSIKDDCSRRSTDWSGGEEEQWQPSNCEQNRSSEQSDIAHVI